MSALVLVGAGITGGGFGVLIPNRAGVHIRSLWCESELNERFADDAVIMQHTFITHAELHQPTNGVYTRCRHAYFDAARVGSSEEIREPRIHAPARDCWHGAASVFGAEAEETVNTLNGREDAPNEHGFAMPTDQ